MIENLLNKDEKETVTLIGYQYLFNHYISEAAFFSFFFFFYKKNYLQSLLFELKFLFEHIDPHIPHRYR